MNTTINDESIKDILKKKFPSINNEEIEEVLKSNNFSFIQGFIISEDSDD